MCVYCLFCVCVDHWSFSLLLLLVLFLLSFVCLFVYFLLLLVVSGFFTVLYAVVACL